MAKKTLAPSTFTVRHYCQGIGDCHLLTFTSADNKPFRMLIDCGIHGSIRGGPRIMDSIVEDIRAETGSTIDVLVLTHEHTDHNSAFDPGADRFSGFKFGEVWMGWTESTNDPQAVALDKFKDQALAALSMASQRLGAVGAALTPGMQAMQGGIDALLSFNFGVKGEKVRGYRDYAVGLAKKVRYLEPKNAPITPKGLPNLRIYVLAPSRNPDYLRITERVGEMYFSVDDASLERVARSLVGADEADDPCAPFDPSLGNDLAMIGSDPDRKQLVVQFARDRYFGPSHSVSPAVSSRPTKGDTNDPNARDQSWRRIDHDWLAASGELAMQLDNKTNNTSLVLAFELVDVERVFLFAADAQIGSWLSWQDANWKLPDGTKVTASDLLARTVYYKVGHHGSENATASGKGLELMTHKDLSAFIPTNKIDAKNVKWGAMPYDKILDELARRCGKRVVRADDPWVVGGSVPFRAPTGSIKRVSSGWSGGAAPSPSNSRQRWVEFELG